MTIAKYRPRTAFVTPFSDVMNGFFNHDIGQFLGQDDIRRTSNAVNIIEGPEAFQLSMLTPGFSKSDLKIALEKDVLTISAEKKEQHLEETERFTRREFVSNAFTRSFKLPEAVNVEGIKAEMTDGVLHVNIPKAVDAKPHTRAIEIV